jgi:transposase
MENLFCGIDISKDYLDFSICQESDKQIILTSKVENTASGINCLLQSLKKETKGKKPWICFEHTGHYGLLLAHQLEKNRIKYSMVPSLDIIKSSGLIRGKTDPVDAQRIALYAATFAHKLEASRLPDKSIQRLKSLLTVRDQFVRIRTQFKNALKSLQFAGENIDLGQEIKAYEKEIEHHDQMVAKLELKIKTIIMENDRLKTNFSKITQVTGIGSITATAMLVYTNNFKAFSNPRKFNCYCGLAPFEYTSGKSVKRPTKTSRYRNKNLKKLLFNAANTAINHDPQIRTYFNRKTREGKHKMCVINAIACKIVLRVFAVVNRNEPFVKFSV